MKILVLSDIHSNIWALRAILQAEGEPDLLCCAGDYTDYGTTPAEVVEFFREYPGKKVLVGGNHDAHVAKTWLCGPFAGDAATGYKWVHHNCARLAQRDVAWLQALPETAVFEADGCAYLLRHQYDAGYGTLQTRAEFEEFWRTFTPKQYWGAPQKRVVLGHTHRQAVHILDEGMLWLNPGSASYRRPGDPDKTAHYAVIENGSIALRRTPYNREPLLQEALRYKAENGMMPSEIEDFEFFFGDAESRR